MRDIITLLVGFFILPALAQNNDGYLRRKNTQIVNNDGAVALKGVNLGNWLHIEPYMINAPTTVAGSETQLRQAITSVTGSSANATAFFETWRTNYIQKKDIDSIASMGFNHVRIPFPYTLFYDDTNQVLTNEGFAYLDSAVLWCKQNDIYAILDLHVAPGGQIDGGLWNSYATNKEITKQVWWHIAKHYAAETAVGGYDILNEPVISVQREQWKLKDLYVAVTNEIRKVDTNHLLFFEGNWYASSFWELTDGTPGENDRWDDNMALSQHVYWVPQPSSTNQWTNTIANAMNVPKWCGEGGENSNHWLNDWVRDCENTNAGWCMWTYKKGGGTSSLYSNPYNANYQAVLDYWKGGTQPSAENAWAGLLLFAQQSDLSFCTYKKDVKDALLRPTFNSTSVPYKRHTLPSTIAAVDYDMGANGIAYADKVFQSTGQGSNFTNYNNGWTYRNDGVDIETWTGTPTIGSIDTNEWLQYTVDVPSEGLYKVSLEYAAPSAGPKVEFFSNGTALIPETTLSATRGWGSFVFQDLDTIEISAQPGFKFKLHITEAGLNIKSIKFEYLGSLNTVRFSAEKPLLQAEQSKLQIITKTPVKEVQIFDLSGKLMQQASYNSATLTRTVLFEKAAGIYMARLYLYDGKVISHKFYWD